MQLIKEKFLKYSIHHQIYIGIFSVSLFVCILVQGLIVLNSYYLLYASHLDSENFLDEKENQEMDLIFAYIDGSIQTYNDMMKSNAQVISNLFTNLNIRASISDCSDNIYENLNNAIPFIEVSLKYPLVIDDKMKIFKEFTFYDFNKNLSYKYSYNKTNKLQCDNKTIFNTLFNEEKITNFKNKISINKSITKVTYPEPSIIADHNESLILYQQNNLNIEFKYSFNFYDKIIEKLLRDLNTTQIIITKNPKNNSNDKNLTSYLSCKYFFNLYNNSDKDYNNKFVNISDCFNSSDYNKTIGKYFDISTPINYTSIIKTNLMLNQNGFKVSRYGYQNYTKIFQNSSFNTNDDTLIYLFKNTLFLEKYKYILEINWKTAFIFILFVNLIIWVFIIIYITVVVINVTIKLTTPINKLIELISSIGKVDFDLEDNKNNMDDINYPDDKHINELISICKNLIKGGFSFNDDKLDCNKFLSNAIYNISFVKLNNIIVDEEQIRKNKSESYKRIFEYNSKNLLHPKEELILNNQSFSQNNFKTEELILIRETSSKTNRFNIDKSDKNIITTTNKELNFIREITTTNNSNSCEIINLISSRTNNQKNELEEINNNKEEQLKITQIVKEFNMKNEKKLAISKLFSMLDFK